MGALDRIFRRRQEQRPLESYVRGLWRSGEQGVWYDPSDLTTLFQDVGGSTPVTAVGQPVGLMLDKRYGPTRGSEQAPADISAGWSSADARWGYAIGSISWAGGGGSNLTTAKVLLPVSFTGKFVEFSFTVSGFLGTGNCGPDAGVLSSGPGGTGTIIDTRISSNGSYRFMGYWRGAGAADGRTLGILGRGTNSFTISNLSVREVLGNHANQGTATSRPTLSGRYNLLTASEQLDAAVWAKTECSVVANVAVGPNGGGADNVIPSTNVAGHYVSQAITSGSESRTMRVVAKAAGCSKLTLYPGASATFAHFDLTAGTTSREASVLSSSISPLGDGWYECVATWAAGLTMTVSRIYASSGSIGAAAVAGDGVSGVLIERSDMRSANDGVGLPEYQRVVDASTYDTQGFPLYLQFDGVDDWLQTASVDFSGTDKATLWAAIRKLSDAARGIVCELGADVNQSFGLAAPNSAGPNIAYYSRGTIQTVASATVAAPTTAVVTGVGDISADITKIAINGAQLAANALDQGAGNLGNLPLYIGRRGGASLPFNGRIYGLIIRGAATPDPTISRVERYLNAKSRAY